MEQVITFRIEAVEKEKIKEEARKIGLRTADFCRMIVLSKIKEEATA